MSALFCQLVLLVLLSSYPSEGFGEAPAPQQNANTENVRGVPVEIAADRIEYDQVREEYHAVGAVDVSRGPVRLTADDATLQKLTGRL
ncbi:MAG: hypothetical protein OEY91_14440, partial [Nitrospirota bacterium]|nr:hypothetical protein [Nitrospirota bacterium]